MFCKDQYIGDKEHINTSKLKYFVCSWQKTSEDTQEFPQLQPSWGTKRRRDEERIMTKQTILTFNKPKTI